MSKLEELLNRLPSHFKKEIDSNNYKLLSLVAQESEDSKVLYDTILKFWDVDEAEGYGLDVLGKEEGISRGSYDDETFRKLIKIQYIVNLSEGDVESINAVLKAYMGKQYLSIQEGWNDSVYGEPASILVNVSDKATTFPHEIMRRIKAISVGVFVVMNELKELLQLSGRTYSFPVNYRITNRFRTSPIHGAKAEVDLQTGEGIYQFSVNYPVCGKFTAKG